MNKIEEDEVRLKKKAKKLYKLLKKADRAYYNTGKTIMSDSKYDKKLDKLELLAKQLRRLNPYSKAVAKLESYLNKEVGATPTGSKVELPVYMPSLSKIKTDEEKKLTRFLTANKQAESILLSPKLDGSSLMLRYDQGKLVSAFTRGNGSIGRDVTVHAKLLAKNGIIPSNLDSKSVSKRLKLKSTKVVVDKSSVKELATSICNTTVYIRGELQIEESLFQKTWKDKKVDGVLLKESRNAVNGFLNRKTPNKLKSFAKDLTFFAYSPYDKKGREWANYSGDKLGSILLLHAFGFSTYLHIFKLVKAKKNLKSELDTFLKKVLDNKQYTCDGIVVECNESTARGSTKKGNPTYMFAYKTSTKDLLNQEVAITTVEKVEWNTSKSGALKPLVWYEPVKFGNSKNIKANGVNAANIKRLGLAKGTMVKVVRGGGVIPQIVASKKSTRKNNPIPKKCYCGAKAVLISKDLYCSKPSKCKYLQYRRLVDSFKKMKVSGLSGKRIQVLYDAGYVDLLKFSKASTKKLAKLPGFSQKIASKIKDDFEEKKIALTLPQYAAISGVFVEPGFALAESRLKLIFSKLKGKALTISESKLESKLQHIPGLGNAAKECFIKNRNRFARFYSSMNN